MTPLLTVPTTESSFYQRWQNYKMVFPFPQTNLCQDDKLVLYCDNQILIEKFPHFQIAVLCVSVKRPRSKNLCKKNIWWQCVWGKECVQTLVKGKSKTFLLFSFFLVFWTSIHVLPFKVFAQRSQ